MSKIELLEGFITDNADIAVLHMLSEHDETEEGISDFIKELHLEDKFLIYCQIMMQQ